eukprot:11686801-Ditylum_brightwellii.AAC.1
MVEFYDNSGKKLCGKDASGGWPCALKYSVRALGWNQKEEGWDPVVVVGLCVLPLVSGCWLCALTHHHGDGQVLALGQDLGLVEWGGNQGRL